MMNKRDYKLNCESHYCTLHVKRYNISSNLSLLHNEPSVSYYQWFGSEIIFIFHCNAEKLSQFSTFICFNSIWNQYVHEFHTMHYRTLFYRKLGIVDNCQRGVVWCVRPCPTLEWTLTREFANDTNLKSHRIARVLRFLFRELYVVIIFTLL